MHINPPNWPTVSKEQWDDFLGNVNWIREGFGGGIWYEFRDGRGRFGFEGDDGKLYLDPKFNLNVRQD